ncbi:MAG: SDR family oxidoreductase [Defluviitaleaceae bacterium]|nr:SDR family oxidoreductase [Defluviitaleaceae bacterium]
MTSRVVLVSGSSRGIGLGIAKAFAAQGDSIVLNAREDAAQLERAVNELREAFPANPKITGILADLADYESSERLFAQVEAEFGAVQVLINNAGAAHFGLFTDMSPPEIHGILAANLHTALNASHRAIPNMVSAKTGTIINITSIWGITGASCETVYSAAKAGVVGLTKSLAKELAPSGICVNAIACGAFETRMNDRLSKDEKNAFAESIPLGRFGLPQEAGDLAVFLASEKAAYLTGQVIPLDGGFL